MKYVLLSLVLLGTSLPGMVSAKSETTSNRQASSFTLEQYQADFKSIGDMVNNMDIGRCFKKYADYILLTTSIL